MDPNGGNVWCYPRIGWREDLHKPIDIGVKIVYKPLIPGHFLLNQYHRHSLWCYHIWNIPKYMPLVSGVTCHIFPSTNPLTSSQIISHLSGWKTNRFDSCLQTHVDVETPPWMQIIFWMGNQHFSNSWPDGLSEKARDRSWAPPRTGALHWTQDQGALAKSWG